MFAQGVVPTIEKIQSLARMHTTTSDMQFMRSDKEDQRSSGHENDAVEEEEVTTVDEYLAVLLLFASSRFSCLPSCSFAVLQSSSHILASFCRVSF